MSAQGQPLDDAEAGKVRPSPTRRRKLLPPPQLVGWLLPLASSAAVMGAVFLFVSGEAQRLAALVALGPATTLIVSTLRVAAPRLRQQWRRERALRRVHEGPLAALGARPRKVVLVGALETKQPLDCDGVPCVAYLRRKERSRGRVEQVSDVAPCALRTDGGEVVPLQSGAWLLASPFTSFDASGVARLGEGARVIVRARVGSFRGEARAGYRDGTLERGLLAAGGWIAPHDAYELSRAAVEAPWKARALLQGFFVALAGVVASLVSQTLSEVDHTRPAPRVALSPSGAATTESGACKPDRSCDAPKVCDAETNTCVAAVAGRLAEGAECSKPGDCQAGLRCRKEPSQEGAWRCVAPCRSDRECGVGRYCVPCMTKPLDVDGDCVERSRISGAVSAVCEMLHGNFDDAPPASPSGTVAPSAPSVSAGASSAPPR